MAFLIYKKHYDFLYSTGEYYSLAGYNLIYNLWKKLGQPTEQGWHATANDLIYEHTGGKESYDTLRLLVDFHPSATWRIGLIELLDIYIYTYVAEKENEASWSPMMLRFRDIYYEEFEYEITLAEKGKKIERLRAPDSQEDFIEFLYLNGTNQGWNWGTNGRTNAAFIQGAARDFFRKYF
jgi:hypothetical protein